MGWTLAWTNRKAHPCIMRARSHSRTARSNGFTFIMLVMMITTVDSSNILDIDDTTSFRESLAVVMLMDLLVMAYLAYRDIKRFRLMSKIITVPFHIERKGRSSP